MKTLMLLALLASFFFLKPLIASGEGSVQRSPFVFSNNAGGQVSLSIPSQVCFGYNLSNPCITGGQLDPSMSATYGIVGSLYMSSNGNLYQKTDNGITTNWSILTGGGGSSIGTWTYGAGAPSGGTNDNFYLDTVSADAYKKTAGSWGTVGNIIGNTLGGYSGYSARYNQVVSLSRIKDTLDFIMDMQYAAPTISLSATPTQSYRENGDTSVTSANLSALATRLSDSITNVKFYAGNCSGTLIQTDTSSPNTGTRTYTDSAHVGSSTFSYCASVTDSNPTTVTSNIVTFPFVYPYYLCVGAQHLTGAQIRTQCAASEQIIPQTSSVNFTSSPSSQVFYECQLSSYTAISHVIDPNGFDITADFTLRTSVAITGLDGTSQNYNCLEYNNPTTQSSFKVTFNQ